MVAPRNQIVRKVNLYIPTVLFNHAKWFFWALHFCYCFVIDKSYIQRILGKANHCIPNDHGEMESNFMSADHPEVGIGLWISEFAEKSLKFGCSCCSSPSRSVGAAEFPFCLLLFSVAQQWQFGLNSAGLRHNPSLTCPYGVFWAGPHPQPAARCRSTRASWHQTANPKC